MDTPPENSRPSRFGINRPLARLAFGVWLFLSAGIISVYLNNQTPVSAYEDKLVFPNLAKDINNISEITLTSRQGSLKFSLSDGIWHLKGRPEFPVYQERIRRF